MTRLMRSAVLMAWLLLPAAVTAQPAPSTPADDLALENWAKTPAVSGTFRRAQEHGPWSRAPVAAPAAGTGMNSPQVMQALDLIQRAGQIEIEAAKTPNNPVVQKTAAAMAENLRGRAAIIMQVDHAQRESQQYELLRLEIERSRDQTPMRCQLPDGRRVECR